MCANGRVGQAQTRRKLGKLRKNIKQDDEAMAKVNFATDARTNFQEGDNKDKKNILLQIGTNRELKDRKLIITPYKWLIPIEKMIKHLEAKFITLELNKTPLNTKQNEAYTSLCRELRRGRDIRSQIIVRRHSQFPRPQLTIPPAGGIWFRFSNPSRRQSSSPAPLHKYKKPS
ncbi:hypothetical protein COT94_03760 [Candidatus Falkowbacteria bacterium CG10_big_fil_rev_8_21_14_0_10_37_14]|uniref:Uncharacterized protein n=1 Tax=Candidatus Falkowbacteria bacterium CG10_big_fil_rev_8_21_14_0_10_37_14 TaxID=1974561 RepID=A0A2M6WSD4_9BACT|nr:MAG: hypothetical protein COT94_03760 [Candidatus Falkowbacteria bacterium CG10_big_fil_rev_8_21_14_0_10_37_14]